MPQITVMLPQQSKYHRMPIPYVDGGLTLPDNQEPEDGQVHEW
jgi:hypothetical protein